MADELDPATMDALNALGDEIEAGAAAAGAAPQADAPPPAGDAPEPEDAAIEPQEGEEPHAEGEGEPEGDGSDEQPAKKIAPKRSGVEKDIQRLLGKKFAAEARAAEAEARAAAAEARAAELEARAAGNAQPLASQLGQPAAAPVVQRQNESGQDFEARVQTVAAQKAQEIAQANAFNAECSRVASKGAEVYKDWEENRRSLMDAFGRQINARPEFLEAIVDLENGHDVFRYLGANLEEAEAIFANPTPTKLDRALVKLSMKLATPKAQKVSNAPAPVNPIRGGGGNRGGVRLDDDKAPIDDWSKQFLKDMAS